MKTAKNHKNCIYYICLLFAAVGAGLMVAGFVVNPRGEIHQSVLIGFGECAAFIAGAFGIDYRKN